MSIGNFRKEPDDEVEDSEEIFVTPGRKAKQSNANPNDNLMTLSSI